MKHLGRSSGIAKVLSRETGKGAASGTSLSSPSLWELILMGFPHTHTSRVWTKSSWSLLTSTGSRRRERGPSLEEAPFHALQTAIPCHQLHPKCRSWNQQVHRAVSFSNLRRVFQSKSQKQQRERGLAPGTEPCCCKHPLCQHTALPHRGKEETS